MIKQNSSSSSRDNTQNIWHTSLSCFAEAKTLTRVEYGNNRLCRLSPEGQWLRLISPCYLTTNQSEVIHHEALIPNEGGINWKTGIDIYTLLYIKEITTKDLLYSTGNSTQYSVIAYMGKEYKKEWIHVYPSMQMIHFTLHLKPTQCCKPTTLQLKKKKNSFPGSHQRIQVFWAQAILLGTQHTNTVLHHNPVSVLALLCGKADPSSVRWQNHYCPIMAIMKDHIFPWSIHHHFMFLSPMK